MATMKAIEIQNKSDLILYLLNRGVLLEEKYVERINETSFKLLYDYIKQKESSSIDYEEKEIINIISAVTQSVVLQKGATSNAVNISVPNELTINKNNKYLVKVTYNYKDFYKKREYSDFVTYFNHRYKSLSKILRNRDLPGLVSVDKLKSNKSRDTFSIIGIVYDVKLTKNGHYMLELEDPTGKIKVLVNKSNEELFPLAKEIVNDEVIAVTGNCGEDIFFSNKIYFPDIPVNRELKRSPDEVYAAFISDLQIGSVRFQEDDFLKFIKWLNGEIGDDSQRKIGRDVKYLFIVGDLVEGIGVFPGQEEELAIKDAYAQYEKAAELLKNVPKDVQVIILPGNHDPLRLSDPQPQISREYAKAMYKLPNTTFLSSPSMVNIHSSKNFPGFDILLYHGFSFFYYADKVEKLRENGGGDRADLVMKFLLQKRHLAPTHASNLYIPDIRGDPMVIDNVPDIVVSGHTHRANALNYRNVTVITCSCWDRISEYAMKFGANPLPGRVPVLNLQTRDVKILKFCN